MGMRSRATGIVTVVLLALPLLPSARADEYSFTFTPGADPFSTCSVAGTCEDFGSGTITTGPAQNNIIYEGAQPIIGLTGTFDGSTSMYFVLQGYPALPSPYGYPIVFDAGGQVWGLWHADPAPGWSEFLVSYTTGTEEPINLTITAPEPSTLLFLSIGLLGVMGLTLLKNRLS